jgi:hypothetical protein
VKLVALVLAALALTACESNQERSAKLEQAAKRHEHEVRQQQALAQRALEITRVSTKIKVTSSAVVHSAQGAAAVLTLRNSSGVTLRDVPIQINVLDSHGTSVFKNDSAGTSATLVSAALVPAHSVITWIDDQVDASGGVPARVLATVGEGKPTAGAVSQLQVHGAHLAEAGEAEGSVANHSRVDQQELVVYAVARRGTTVVAAGRAVLADVAAGSSTPFQVYFVGDPADAQVLYSVPATSAG